MNATTQTTSNDVMVDVSDVQPCDFNIYLWTSKPLPRRLVDRYRVLGLPGANLASTWPRKTLKRKLDAFLRAA